MSLRNTPTSYGSVSKFLHWSVFVLLAFMLVLGYFLDDMPKAYKFLAYDIHKLTGLTILILMLFRILWRLSNPVPSFPVEMKPLQRAAAYTVHALLYISVICMPLFGWIGSCAAGYPPSIGSLEFNLPVAHSEPLVMTMFELHGTFAILILVLAGMHILAALYHHFIERDNILRRMLP